MHQCRHGHYIGNTYDLPRATNWFNTRTQANKGTRVQTAAQKIAVPEKNMQEQHQYNLVIDSTTLAYLEYTHLIKGLM